MGDGDGPAELRLGLYSFRSGQVLVCNRWSLDAPPGLSGGMRRDVGCRLCLTLFKSWLRRRGGGGLSPRSATERSSPPPRRRPVRVLAGIVLDEKRRSDCGEVLTDRGGWRTGAGLAVTDVSDDRSVPRTAGDGTGLGWRGGIDIIGMWGMREIESRTANRTGGGWW